LAAKVTDTVDNSFGGVMFWDASQAYNNNRFDKAVKSFLGSTCGTTFNYPACDAPAWAASGQYPAGSKVSYIQGSAASKI
jgi:chitinase